MTYAQQWKGEENSNELNHSQVNFPFLLFMPVYDITLGLLWESVLRAHNSAGI